VSDHGKHFENEIFVELSSNLGFSHDFSSHITLSPTNRSRLSTKSSKPCYNMPSINIRPTSIICFFLHYGLIAWYSKLGVRAIFVNV
jgi:hypothetical protein